MWVRIVESEAYRRAAENYGDARTMDEIKESFDFILSVEPEYGHRVPPFENLYVFQTTEFYPRMPAFRVIYRYDPEDDLQVVELLHIEPVNLSPDFGG